jgi:hypothetical protein
MNEEDPCAPKVAPEAEAEIIFGRGYIQAHPRFPFFLASAVAAFSWPCHP